MKISLYLTQFSYSWKFIWSFLSADYAYLEDLCESLTHLLSALSIYTLPLSYLPFVNDYMALCLIGCIVLLTHKPSSQCHQNSFTWDTQLA